MFRYKKLKSTHKQTITNALSKVQSLEEALQLQKELCTNSNESLLEARAQKEALEEEISELKDAVQVGPRTTLETECLPTALRTRKLKPCFFVQHFSGCARSCRAQQENGRGPPGAGRWC